MAKRKQRKGAKGNPAKEAARRQRATVGRASRSVDGGADAYARADLIVAAAFPDVDAQATGWLTMIYACAGLKLSSERSSCPFEHRVWCGLGVEGPAVVAAGMIPSPFFCGACPQCGGRLVHDRWGEDEEHDPPVPIPASAARFILPVGAVRRRNYAAGYAGAHYVDPTGVTL